MDKKGENMDKKAFIMHPATWIIVSFFLGFIFAWITANGIIDIGIPICPG